MAFPENFLQELIERNDITDVVGGYVRLTKRSGSNQFGLCPFHSEKTPSFSVSADKQIYHCFGCGKGGGVINFIMEIESLSYPEAVEFLAKRVGMTMPEEENSSETRRKRRMLELNREAARFFFSELTKPGGRPAQSYLENRKISAAAVKRFGLGYAPDTWDSLTNAMKQKGFAESELRDAGLVRSGKNGSVYDTFRNRLMFPVIDVRGDVIGFSGRMLGDGEPKYMNSPETLVFNKSRNLFALNLAKKSKSGYIILAEGNIDVVMMHQAGFDSAVASLGTSLTSEQARLISRYANEVVIAYDSDNAGKKAAQRAIGLLEKLDVRVRVLSMNGAKDPDEYIKKNGADAFRELLEKSENHIEYRLQRVTDKYDLTVDEQRVAFIKDAAELVATLPGSVERQVYAMRVAELAKVPDGIVEDEVEKRRKKAVKTAQRDIEKSVSHPERQLQPKEKDFAYSDPASAAAEEGLIRLLYLDPGLFRGREKFDSGYFSSPVLKKIYDVLYEKFERGEPLSMAGIGDRLEPRELSLLAGIIQKPEMLRNGEKALTDYTDRIKHRNINSSEQDLRELANRLKKTKGYEGKANG